MNVKTEADGTTRIHYIDWLRVITTIAVFLMHSALFFGYFDGMPWQFYNSEKSTIATVFVGFLDLWLMPLFFLLAGVGSWYSLKHRTKKEYIIERIKRLLVPLYIIGLAVLLPPQFYLSQAGTQGYTGGYLELLPKFYSQIHFHISDPIGLLLLPRSVSCHLWFLQELFLISVLFLPLMVYLASDKGMRIINRIAGLFAQKGGVLLFLVPQVIVMVSLRSFFSGRYSWAEFFSFSLFFLVGFLIPSDIRFTESLKRHGWFCLALGLAGVAGEALFVFGLGYKYPRGESFSVHFILFQVVISFASWCLIVFFLSAGARLLNFKNRMLAYANEAVLPFYIIHQTAVYIAAWFIISLDAPVLAKFLMVVIASFVMIMGIYDIFVKRLRLLRFLFGMKTRTDA